MSDGECRFHPIGHVAAGAMSSHCSVPFTDRADSFPAAGLIDHSAGPVGESLLLMGASDRGEGRHLVEKIAVDEVRDRTSRSRIGTGAISCLPARISCYVPQTRLDKRRLHSRFPLHSHWLGSRELREMVMWRS